MTSSTTFSPLRERWLLLTIAGVQFTHILDFMIMMPLGPQFTRLFGISDAQFGLLVSAYTISAGISGLVSATYVDRFDRKRLLLVLYGLFAVATLACGLVGSYGFLMVARIAAGVFGGVLSALAQTIVADVVPFERRGRAMGIVMSSFAVTTVAGVPLGLLLANAFGWQATFVAIAVLCAVLCVGAALTLPPLLMFTGFTVIPFITIYMQANVGLTDDDIPLIYLVGGAATLVTARWFGRMTDRIGKVPTFNRLALAAAVPLLAVTLLPPAPLWQVLFVSTAFFALFSGRMIPGMAILTSAAQPALRGTFMALNASVQSASMGMASLLGGLIIDRDAAGRVEHYGVAGLVGWSPACAASRWRGVSSCMAAGLEAHQLLTFYCRSGLHRPVFMGIVGPSHPRGRPGFPLRWLVSTRSKWRLSHEPDDQRSPPRGHAGTARLRHQQT